MARKNLCEALDGQVFGRHREDAPNALFRLGRDESRRGVVAFQNEFPAEQLVSAAVGSSHELREYLEMGFGPPDRTLGLRAVLQHKEVAEKRLWTAEVGAFTVGRPQIEGAPHRLFRPVVEIVAERSNLGFGFNCNEQSLVPDDQQVPFLGGAKESRQFDILPAIHARLRNSGGKDNLREQINEPIHLRTTGNGTSQSLIALASLPLFLLLASTRCPVMFNGAGNSCRKIPQDVVLSHGHGLSDCLFQ